MASHKTTLFARKNSRNRAHAICAINPSVTWGAAAEVRKLPKFCDERRIKTENEPLILDQVNFEVPYSNITCFY